MGTIRKYRPELLLMREGAETSSPIPEQMPAHYVDNINKAFYVEDIGEPTAACFMTKTNVDPTNW